MGVCIGASKVLERSPVAYLTCNGSPPVGDTPSLMTFREVRERDGSMEDAYFLSFFGGGENVFFVLECRGEVGIWASPEYREVRSLLPPPRPRRRHAHAFVSKVVIRSGIYCSILTHTPPIVVNPSVPYTFIWCHNTWGPPRRRFDLSTIPQNDLGVASKNQKHLVVCAPHTLQKRGCNCDSFPLYSCLMPHASQSVKNSRPPVAALISKSCRKFCDGLFDGRHRQTPPPRRDHYFVWMQVETLFHEFGHGLQHMLTTMVDGDCAGAFPFFFCFSCCPFFEVTAAMLLCRHVFRRLSFFIASVPLIVPACADGGCHQC